MTANQIAYWKMKEDQRHNVASEHENVRHNYATESESQRHNTATEFVDNLNAATKQREAAVSEQKVPIEAQKAQAALQSAQASLTNASTNASIAPYTIIEKQAGAEKDTASAKKTGKDVEWYNLNSATKIGTDIVGSASSLFNSIFSAAKKSK